MVAMHPGVPFAAFLRACCCSNLDCDQSRPVRHCARGWSAAQCAIRPSDALSIRALSERGVTVVCRCRRTLQHALAACMLAVQTSLALALATLHPSCSGIAGDGIDRASGAALRRRSETLRAHHCDPRSALCACRLTRVACICCALSPHSRDPPAAVLHGAHISGDDEAASASDTAAAAAGPAASSTAPHVAAAPATRIPRASPSASPRLRRSALSRFRLHAGQQRCSLVVSLERRFEPRCAALALSAIARRLIRVRFPLHGRAARPGQRAQFARVARDAGG